MITAWYTRATGSVTEMKSRDKIRVTIVKEGGIVARVDDGGQSSGSGIKKTSQVKHVVAEVVSPFQDLGSNVS